MTSTKHAIKSVAVIGAGASGAAAAAALKAEDYFETIRVFERRESAGGTWIYDAKPENIPLRPGVLPPGLDASLRIPKGPFPRTTPRGPDSRVRFETTPIYDKLTTNVPDIAMSFTDLPFPYGPFVPHWIPKQYTENYFAWHRLDDTLVLRTTVEDVTLINRKRGKWRLTLRQPEPALDVNKWWQEEFDALVIANGHYSVPFIPQVDGLESFIANFPLRVEHSKSYRSPEAYSGQRVLLIGNSASGHDVMTQLVDSKLCKDPVYVSRRSPSRWDGPTPPAGIVWKPIVSLYDSKTGEIHFEDGTKLQGIDKVIYCTGYKASFPFWNERKNGRAIWDYENDRLTDNYQHTFPTGFPTLAFIGIPRVLTFRSFEYQSIAVARLWSNRASHPLPSEDVQRDWFRSRAEFTRNLHQKFHQIEWDTGEAMEWFRYLFELAGLPVLEGAGKCPPVLGPKTRWTIDHVKKYPDYGRPREEIEDEWEVVHQKDSLWFL